MKWAWLAASALAIGVGLSAEAQEQKQGPATPPAAKPAPGPLDIKVFADLPSIERPQLSPDGKRIAARIAANGTQYFAIMAADGSDRKLVGAGDADINWWRWVNNDWLVIGVGREQEVEGEPWYISRAVGVEARTARLVPLNARDTGQNGDDLIWVARDGTARVLLAAQTSIYSNDAGFWPKIDEVDVTTGKHKSVMAGREGVRAWYADGAGVVRMGIGMSMDGRQRRLLYRPTARDSFRVIDRAKGIHDGLLVPSLFLPDPGKAMVVQDDDKGFSALWEFDLTTMQRGKQVFASPGFDISGPVVDPQTATLLGVEVSENRSLTRWLDPGMAALQKKLSERVKGAQVDISSFSTDRSIVMAHVGDASAPGAWFLYRAADDTMTVLAFDNAALELRRLHPVQTIQYKARDGLEISAILTVPRRSGRKNLPLILMPHGGPFARDVEEWDWWAQFLADRGYAVIQPNYRGSSGYGTPFTQKGEGQWGLAMQDDLNDAVKTLVDQGIADPKRVCVVGASYGGYAALRAAQRDGALYRCAVSYAGVSDLGRLLQYDSRALGHEASGDWLKAQAPNFKQVSPLFHADEFSIPVLLMHGKKDRRVPFNQSKLMAERLKAAGKTFEFIEQPQADHFFTRGEDRLTFLKALEAFLAKYNPA